MMSSTHSPATSPLSPRVGAVVSVDGEGRRSHALPSGLRGEIPPPLFEPGMVESTLSGARLHRTELTFWDNTQVWVYVGAMGLRGSLDRLLGRFARFLKLSEPPHLGCDDSRDAVSPAPIPTDDSPRASRVAGFRWLGPAINRRCTQCRKPNHSCWLKIRDTSALPKRSRLKPSEYDHSISSTPFRSLQALKSLFRQ